MIEAYGWYMSFGIVFSLAYWGQGFLNGVADLVLYRRTWGYAWAVFVFLLKLIGTFWVWPVVLALWIYGKVSGEI